MDTERRENIQRVGPKLGYKLWVPDELREHNADKVRITWMQMATGQQGEWEESDEEPISEEDEPEEDINEREEGATARRHRYMYESSAGQLQDRHVTEYIETWLQCGGHENYMYMYLRPNLARMSTVAINLGLLTAGCRMLFCMHCRIALCSSRFVLLWLRLLIF
jgi:hypothetical protein